MVQIMTSAEEDSKSKPIRGTLYTLEKASQKGTSLTITAYVK